MTVNDDQIRFGLGESDPITIGNNTPTALDDPHVIWLVCAGRVDVFVAHVRRGGQVGVRRHIMRVEAGGALFGLNLPRREGESMRVFMVGDGSTQIAQLSRTRFLDCLRDPMTTAQAVALLDGWVRIFTGSMNGGMDLRQYVGVESGMTIDLEPGQYARPRRNVVWVSCLRGSVQYISLPEIPLITDDDFLPVCPDSWVYAEHAASVRALDTISFAAAYFSWDHLDNFHQVILNRIAWSQYENDDRERERWQRRVDYDRDKFNLALSNLSSPLVSHPLAGARVRGLEESLLVACRLVGWELGAQIKRPADPVDGVREVLNLDGILRASGLRSRIVTLKAGWWRHDRGPLLVFGQEDKRPLALIPAGAGRYEMHDPEKGTRHIVNGDIARTLPSSAYVFYPALPNRPLTLGDLVRFGLQGSRPDLLNILLMGVGAGLLGVTVPLVTGQIIDGVIPFADQTLLLQLILILLVAAGVVALFQVVQTIAVLRVEIKLDERLQAAIWDRVLRLPAPFFREYSAGDLSMRIMGVSTIRRTLSGTVVRTLLAALFSVFNLLLLFYFSVDLALIALVLLAAPVLMTILAVRVQMRHHKLHADIQGRISGMVLQFITGISKLRVAGVEKRAFARWANQFAEQKRTAFRIGRIESTLSVFNGAYPVLTSIVIFAGTAAVADFSTGVFLAFIAAFTQFLYAGLELSTALIAAAEVVPAYERMKPILGTQPEVDETRIMPNTLTGEIEVNRLSFRYDPAGPLILDDISFQVGPGQFVAIVGPSGSGKSTLLRLLLGFERPGSGAIYYDGQNLASLDLYAFRQQLGVVLQNSQLMIGDIFANIVGVAPLTLRDAWEAARMAGLEDDIRQMPMGMHTLVSEGGSTLSGGQRQRLLIARAIARKPNILFLDEATSALDNNTQAHVSDSLEKLEATRIVIAHRLSTVRNADQILVIDGGRLVERGTYTELLAGDGLFAELAKRQLI